MVQKEMDLARIDKLLLIVISWTLRKNRCCPKDAHGMFSKIKTVFKLPRWSLARLRMLPCAPLQLESSLILITMNRYINRLKQDLNFQTLSLATFILCFNVFDFIILQKISVKIQ